MTTRKLTYYTDPGHGWLKVNRSDLDTLDIAHQITPYSYERGDYVYLEEDIDAQRYIDAAHAKGWIVTTRTNNEARNYSIIRTYEHYSPRVTPAALINAAQRLGRLHIVHVTH
jgi:hypothetical protein